ncbi:hypothetical protein CFC21_001002 [Triticum aestivum]|uniref:RING-type domain-containing protein n=1 Tax=Triticum aestivum TaxID=4565 RepID=A0A3B5XVN2_WHEAT|nr:E3 ubiquitin-protein ligase SIRP1-like [Triticum aestivum]KAF6982636.1 hypothetical protein CFC21_001002 [Triticum aestivum]
MESAARGGEDHVENGCDAPASGSGRRRGRDEFERPPEWDALDARLDEQERLDREQDERRDPASLPAMLALPLAKAGETREHLCLICFDDFVPGCYKKIRTMDCTHSFHQRCIFDWLLIDRRCPLCRFAMASEKERLLEEEQQERLHGQGAAAAPAEDVEFNFSSREDVDIDVGTNSS